MNSLICTLAFLPKKSQFPLIQLLIPNVILYSFREKVFYGVSFLN